MEQALIRRTQEADAEAILGLDKECRRTLCAPSYPPGTYDRWLETITTSDYLEPIAYAYKSFVAIQGDHIIGYACVKDYELQNICVHPSHVRAGIGAALFRGVELAVLSAEFSKLTLLATLNSESFFSSMGCERIKSRKLTLVEDIVIDAIFFEKRLLKIDRRNSATGRFTRETD